MRASHGTSPVGESAPAVSDFTFSFNCIADVPLDVRCRAAREAGFTEIGLSLRWMEGWLAEGHTLAELDDTLAQHGVTVAELEAVRVMGPEPDPREDLAAMLAEHLRPARLQSVGPYEGSLDEAAARVAQVADRFAPWGVEVVLEPLPFTNMRTPADAADIIRRADRPNVSMCMDVWHLYRNELPLSHLDDLWPYISTVQFNDGTIECQYPDDLREDCLINRRVPGEGEFDLVGLVQARNRHRPDSTWSIEVINTTLKDQDPMLSARQIADGLAGVLTASRES
jgi:sugar phosphate isomerase/epimerase